MLVKCDFCHKKVYKRPVHIKKHKIHFCSRKCKDKYYHLPHVIKERFLKYVEKKENNCWLWIGNKEKAGYGTILFKGKNIKAHRMSWIIHNGEIPKDMLVLHKCDNPQCVNPEHLFLGTHQDNMDDMVKKGRGKSIIGEKHYTTNLKKCQIIEIYSLYKKGTYSQTQLAKQYNVCQQTISNIVNRKTWKHIED